MSAQALPPLTGDLVARLRAAGAAGSPGEARTWLHVRRRPGRAVPSILQLIATIAAVWHRRG